jgi:hypothetical protein
MRSNRKSKIRNGSGPLKSRLAGIRKKKQPRKAVIMYLSGKADLAKRRSDATKHLL